MNTTIILTFCVQLALALVGAVTGTVQTLGDAKGASYLGAGDKKTTGFAYLLIQQVGTWILIFTNFVPISLMVTVELVKFWQAMFMTTDFTMFDEEQDMAMRA